LTLKELLLTAWPRYLMTSSIENFMIYISVQLCLKMSHRQLLVRGSRRHYLLHVRVLVVAAGEAL